MKISKSNIICQQWKMIQANFSTVSGLRSNLYPGAEEATDRLIDLL